MQVEAGLTVFAKGQDCIKFMLQGEAANADMAVGEKFKEVFEKIKEGGYLVRQVNYDEGDLY